MRKDSYGFFWEDAQTSIRSKSAEKEKRQRPLAPIPDTGWEPPKEFPRLSSASVIGFDTETYDPDLKTKGPGVRRDGHIIGISVATEDRSWYFPMRHTIGPNLDPDKVIRWAKSKDGLGNNIRKIGANPIYDLDYLAQEGVRVGGTIVDIQVIEALLDENRWSYELDSLAHDYLGVGKNSEMVEAWILKSYGKGEGGDFRKDLWRTPSTLVGPYAEADALLPLQILKKQMIKIRAEKLEQVCDIEMRLIPLLLAMRRRGVRVDLARASEIDEMLTSMIKEQNAKLSAYAGISGGRDINVNSPEELARLFDKLGLAYPKTAKTKKGSFTKGWLANHPHEVAQQITQIRTWKKFQDTFVHGYVFDLHVSERIHCQFNQARSDEYGTVSGRFSSSLPNLQNIPHRDPTWGPRIRSIFVPEEEETWVKFDWSQIEFRLLTHYGKGKSADAARRAYQKDPSTDFHRMVSHMTGVDRGPAKNINFGLVYGMGKELLAAQIGISLEEAEPIFDQYHSQLSFVRDAYDEASYDARRNGYIQTLLGRRRRFDLWERRYNDSTDVNARALHYEAAKSAWGEAIRRAFTHKALNGKIQGGAADLMKKAMVDIWESGVCDPAILGAPLLTVHDELDWSADESRAECREALIEVKKIMENCVKLKIPIIAVREDGPNWGETKE